MKLTLLQTDIVWADPAANQKIAEEMMLKAEKSDIYVLPEMFSTGFATQPQGIAEPVTVPEASASGIPTCSTLEWMKRMADKLDAAVCGSVAVCEEKPSSILDSPPVEGLGEVGKSFFNRFYFVKPGGEVSVYDKKHLFSIGMEREAFSGGDTQTTVSYKGWNISLSVCYDVRFPVWMRNKNNNYDILINVANWPTARIDGWTTLLKARAIENQAYVCGSNRIGVDNLCIEYNGQSVVYDFKGKTMATAESDEKIIVAEFDKEALEKFRKKFPVWKDADAFEIKR